MNLIDKEIDELFSLEWLETNGLGSFASSTVAGANTRRYHGLLVASSNAPTERNVLVAKVEERILRDGSYDDLSVNQYPDTIHPKGYQFLKTFTRRPIATWHYEGTTWHLEKKIYMVSNSNTTVLVYANTGDKPFDLELHPLLVQKDYHATFRQNDFDFGYLKQEQDSFMKIHAYPSSPPLFIGWSKGDFTEDRSWYNDIELSREHYRGQDYIEDFYRIGYLSATLKPGQQLNLILTTEESMVRKRASSLEKGALKHLKSLENPNIKNTFYNDLLVSGNQFIVNRASTNSKTIIAGYHWFTDWGRDTMIVMRGLTIATGDQKTSKSILSTFLKYVDKGMLPNRFPDYEGQQVAYNTIDATLWLFVALYEYRQKFDDQKFIDEHLTTLEEILLYHIKGTRYNIHLTDRGFISGGEENCQLTWMDAKVDGHVVTPRIGCAVEINALWYNAMCIYEQFCEASTSEILKTIKATKKKFLKNFKQSFWNEHGYLNDVITEKHVDTSFRPNQIYAVSLPFSFLTKKEEKEIVDQVGKKLLTPYGLRTLEMDNAEFKGHYGGDQWQRDNAYHQGTVWPFLLMEYWEAYLKVNRFSKKAKLKVVQGLLPLKEHFYRADGLYGISEIFDGADPKEGRGCIQQAWSVAALVKLYAQHELYHIED